MAELESCLPGSSVAADATRVSAGCWEGTMNLKLGRTLESTEVSPFIDPGEQVWSAETTCSSSLKSRTGGACESRTPSEILTSTSDLHHTEADEHSNRGPAAVAKC